MRKIPNPDLIDAENPEWTAEQIAKARPAREVLPEIFGAKVAREMLRPRSRPSGTSELPTPPLQGHP